MKAHFTSKWKEYFYKYLFINLVNIHFIHFSFRGHSELSTFFTYEITSHKRREGVATMKGPGGQKVMRRYLICEKCREFWTAPYKIIWQRVTLGAKVKQTSTCIFFEHKWVTLNLSCINSRSIFLGVLRAQNKPKTHFGKSLHKSYPQISITSVHTRSTYYCWDHFSF